MSISRTAYTSFLLEKEVTTATDFLKLCLREFGVLAHLRDERLSPDIPTSVSEDNSYANDLTKAKAELDLAMKMTDAEWKAKLDSQIADTNAAAERQRKEIEEADAILLPMKERIERWDCSDEYLGIKKFALDQIEKTIPDEFYRTYYEKELAELTSESLDSFKQSHIECAKRAVEYFEDELNRVSKDNSKSNKFLAGFFTELGKLDGK